MGVYLLGVPSNLKIIQREPQIIKTLGTFIDIIKSHYERLQIGIALCNRKETFEELDTRANNKVLCCASLCLDIYYVLVEVIAYYFRNFKCLQ